MIMGLGILFDEKKKKKKKTISKWRKTKSTRNETIFINTKLGLVLYVTKGFDYNKITKRFIKSNWDVLVSNKPQRKYRQIIETEISTKYEALKIAKSYMKRMK